MTHQWAYQEFDWDDLTSHNKKLFENIELDFMPLRRNIKRLNEYVELSDKTINQIFTNAEQISKDKKIRTSFGSSIHLPKDGMIQVNKVLGNFGKRMQESTPVKAFDQKFEDAKAKLTDKLMKTNGGRKTLAYIDILGNAAKEHPVWQAATIGLLVGVSTFIAGPAGAMIVGPMLKGAVELVKGEKLSTAIGKGLYAGALGFLSASVAAGLTHWAEGIRMHITPLEQGDVGIEKLSFSGGALQQTNGFYWTKVFRFSDITVDPQLKHEINRAIIRLGGGDFSAYDDLLSLGAKAKSSAYLEHLSDMVASANADQINNDAFLNSVKKLGLYITAAAGGVGAGAASLDDKQSASAPREYPSMPATPAASNQPSDLSSTIQKAKERVRSGNLPRYTKEALLKRAIQARVKLIDRPSRNRADMQNMADLNEIIKTLRGELQESIMEGLWSDLTLKFGAGKLKQAWQASGRPTDSTDIARMLADMGMDVSDIKDVMTNAGMSESDVDETIKELHSGNDEAEFELPFTSGDPKLDSEAGKILKTKGKDAFIAYWEGKAGEIQKEIERQTAKPEPETPVEPEPTPTAPPAAEPVVEPTPEPAAPEEPPAADANELMNKLDAEDIAKRNKKRAAPAKPVATPAIRKRKPVAK